MIIIFLLAAFVLAIVIQQYFLTNTLKNVTYNSHPSKGVVQPDEDFEIISEIHNEKWLPELYIRVSERLPTGTAFKVESENWNHMTFYMRPYQRIITSIPISLPKRGRYLLYGAILTGGDFFGTKTKTETYSQFREVVVVPRQEESPVIDKLLGGFLGDVSVRRFIIPDPVLTVGVREYTGYEPLKDISWAHSARAGQILVKRYDYTLEAAATVMLNIQPDSNNTSEEVIEQCLCICRTVCEELERKSIKYSFITNAVAVGSMRLGGSLVDGLGQGHLLAILEWLGRASTKAVSEGFESLLHKSLRKAEQGRFYIIITPVTPDKNLQPLINRLRVVTGGEVLMVTPAIIME